MTEIPTWLLVTWLIISGLAFLANFVFYAVLIYVVKNKLAPMVQQTATKVEDLTAKVEKVAVRVEEVAGQIGETVGNVGQKATGIMGSVELIAQSASRQFERFSPYLVGAMTAMRLVKALNEMKHGKSPAEATKNKTLEKKPAKTAPKKKILGIF